MDCRKAQEMLSAYHDGELSAADRAQVETHLRGCPGCATLLESMARIDAAAEIPDPGPEYWERFNRRVGDRIGREESGPRGTVVPHPKRGWVRQQLRYLVPAAAAAVLAVVVFRNLGHGPGAPVSPPAPPAMESARVPAPVEAPAPPILREGKERAAPTGYPRSAEGNGVAGMSRKFRAMPETPAPAGAPPETGSPGSAVGAAKMKDVFPVAPERTASMGKASEGASARKGQAAGAAAPMASTGERMEVAAKGKGDSGNAMPAVGCEEARALASEERLREAEAAQRACLARDASPAAQEGGLLFLAELLDRQHRSAEADTVIEEVQERFPGSRRLESYRQRRERVRKGQVPVPPGR